jgi:hypothetical protein
MGGLFASVLESPLGCPWLSILPSRVPLFLREVRSRSPLFSSRLEEALSRDTSTYWVSRTLPFASSRKHSDRGGQTGRSTAYDQTVQHEQAQLWTFVWERPAAPPVPSRCGGAAAALLIPDGENTSAIRTVAVAPWRHWSRRVGR